MSSGGPRKMRQAKSVSGSSLQRRLDKHLLGCAAAAAAGGALHASHADAAIQYSGPLNVVVNPATSSGVYINMDGLTTGVSAATTPGCDLNIFNAPFTNNGVPSGNGVLLYTLA